MNANRLTGLVAATYTPFRSDGSLNLDVIPAMVEYLVEHGVSGLYVCGSTGEGMSLSSSERTAVTKAYVESVSGRVPVIAQVGHNSIREAQELASRAKDSGVDIISATCPSYFKIDGVDKLVQSMAEVASAAPGLPFYYYHIPALTGSTIDMRDFLRLGADQIPSLRGLKYTDTKLHEFQECSELDDGRFDVVWGCDEMLLGAIATGANGAIGSTYNIAAPLYLRMIGAFQNGGLDEARRWQARSVLMIRTIARYPFHAAMKSLLRMLGLDVGPCRLPQGNLSPEQSRCLRGDLEAIGYFDWAR